MLMTVTPIGENVVEGGVEAPDIRFVAGETATVALRGFDNWGNPVPFEATSQLIEIKPAPLEVDLELYEEDANVGLLKITPSLAHELCIRIETTSMALGESWPLSQSTHQVSLPVVSKNIKPSTGKKATTKKPSAKVNLVKKPKNMASNASVTGTTKPAAVR